jgi:hypothetical protein
MSGVLKTPDMFGGLGTDQSLMIELVSVQIRLRTMICVLCNALAAAETDR